jgi:hypothetical protein
MMMFFSSQISRLPTLAITSSAKPCRMRRGRIRMFIVAVVKMLGVQKVVYSPSMPVIRMWIASLGLSQMQREQLVDCRRIYQMVRGAILFVIPSIWTKQILAIYLGCWNLAIQSFLVAFAGTTTRKLVVALIMANELDVQTLLTLMMTSTTRKLQHGL